MSSVSGLSARHRIEARDLAVRAAVLGLRRAPRLHYTQGGSRWQGINLDLKAWKGECPNYADCSAFVTWCIWNGLDHYGVRDTVNGLRWKAGYTGSMANHGKLVRHRSNVLRADAALYGDPFGRTGHTALCVGGGRVISFGSEAGPFLLPIDYRSDLREIRRYI